MRTRSALLLLVLALPLCLAVYADGEIAADPWTVLFDGETLDGWTQLNGTATYEVRDHTIVGQTTQGSPNSFLCSDEMYADFELEFEVKCDPALNSGVQIRSLQNEADNGRVFGPQVEIEGGPGQAGFIYGEATQYGWLSPEPDDPDTAINQHSYFVNDDWNSYRVIAEGPRIRTFINGHAIADLTHEGIYETHREGFIGLQVHAIGADQGPFQVAWRNIRIRDLAE